MTQRTILYNVYIILLFVMWKCKEWNKIEVRVLYFVHVYNQERVEMCVLYLNPINTRDNITISELFTFEVINRTPKNEITCQL